MIGILSFFCLSGCFSIQKAEIQELDHFDNNDNNQEQGVAQFDLGSEEDINMLDGKSLEVISSALKPFDSLIVGISQTLIIEGIEENGDILKYHLSASLKNGDPLIVIKDGQAGTNNKLLLITTDSLWERYKSDIWELYEALCSQYNRLESWADIIIPPNQYSLESVVSSGEWDICPQDIVDKYRRASELLYSFIINGLVPDGGDTAESVAVEDRCYYPLACADYEDMEGLCSYLKKYFSESFVNELLEQYPENIIETDGRLLGWYKGEYPGDMTVGSIEPESVSAESGGVMYLKVKTERYTAGGLRLHAFDEYHYFKMIKERGEWVFDDLYIIGAL